MNLVTTNATIDQEAITSKSTSALIALINRLRSAFARKTRPHYYHNEKEIRLERAQQDVNRFWMHGRSF